MICVVTGGAGFIGSHVAAELISRHFDVIVFDIARQCEQLKGITLVQEDIRNFPRLRATIEAADFVFHLCGILGTRELFDTPREAIDINMNGALNVLLAAKDARKRKRIFFPTKPNEWNNIYSVTSQAVEKLGHAYREYMGLDVRVLRLSNVYGPRQKLFPVRKVIPFFVFQALENRPIEIFGDGTQTLELLYVSDVAKSIVNFVMKAAPVSETFELRAKAVITAEALARKIIAMTDSTSELIRLPPPIGVNPEIQFHHARDVQEIVGNWNSTEVDTGIRETINWYRNLSRQELAMARCFYERK